MLEDLLPIAAACDLSIPVAHRRPVALVGAGSIVDVAHLPAYTRAGLEVRGIFDLDQDRAREVAGRHGVRRVYASLEEVVADEEVDVVDIAVVASAQPEIARRMLDAGKHVLCQKPFAPDLATATRLVEHAERQRRKIAVNQQMRFEEGMAAARALVQQGWIGEVTAVSFTVDISTDFSGWTWLAQSPQLEIRYHSIHYLDSIRALLGDPRRVYCVGSRTPGQAVVGETRTMTILSFDDGVNAVLHVNHENRTDDPRAEFRIDGVEGSVTGTIGLLYDYPHGRPDTLRVRSSSRPTDGWVPYPVTRRWIPDAFAGPMGSLLWAVATGGEPETSGQDNLGTLALVEALYRSMDSGRSETLHRT